VVDLFWTVAIILVVLWLFGLIGGVGGELINILVIAAVVIIAYRLYEGKDVVTGK
jgi:uncharacterized membrane protein required for colicin V production